MARNSTPSIKVVLKGLFSKSKDTSSPTRSGEQALRIKYLCYEHDSWILERSP